MAASPPLRRCQAVYVFWSGLLTTSQWGGAGLHWILLYPQVLPCPILPVIAFPKR